MTNTSIYPTFLYIKQHDVTGLKYFGKTSKKDPYKYLGSGKHWRRHIKKHGKDHVRTIWVSEPYTDAKSVSEFALKFSKENNIVESADWANLMDENGLDGGVKGRIVSEEHKRNMSASLIGRTFTKESRQKMSASHIGKIFSSEHKRNMSASLFGRIVSEETRAKISLAKIGKPGKPCSEETRAKMSASMIGKKRKPCSEETRAKISASMIGKKRKL